MVDLSYHIKIQLKSLAPTENKHISVGGRHTSTLILAVIAHPHHIYIYMVYGYTYIYRYINQWRCILNLMLLFVCV